MTIGQSANILPRDQVKHFIPLFYQQDKLLKLVNLKIRQLNL